MPELWTMQNQREVISPQKYRPVLQASDCGAFTGSELSGIKSHARDTRWNHRMVATGLVAEQLCSGWSATKRRRPWLNLTGRVETGFGVEYTERPSD